VARAAQGRRVQPSADFGQGRITINSPGFPLRAVGWWRGGETSHGHSVRWLGWPRPRCWFHGRSPISSGRTSAKDPLRIVGRVVVHHVPGGFGQLAGQRLGGDHRIGLLFLAIVEAPALGVVLAGEVGGFHKRPGQVTVAVLAVVLAFLLAVALAQAFDAAAVAGEVSRAGEAGGLARDGVSSCYCQLSIAGLEMRIGGIYEEKGGKTLCHVFAGGKRLCTFEPASGGPYAMIWAPKTLWAHATETFVSATSWPFQQNRTPTTVLVTTLLMILFTSIYARRGFGVRSSPAAAGEILRWLAKFLLLLGEKAGMRASQLSGRDAFHRVRRITSFSSVRTNDQGRGETRPYHDVEIVPTIVLTHRERRWFTQPLWRQSLSVFLMVALIFSTTPTDVQAQTYTPVFYYYVGDHLGSSNVMTDRNGVVVEHYEYTAFGFAKCSTGSAFQVSNRYTGQELDEETGLYYYGSRYYDPALGRFIQPDTIVPDPGNSQALNRYTYVNNNPLKYTDPTGHFVVELIVGIVIAAALGAGVGAAVSAARGGSALQGAAMGAISGALIALGSLGGLPGVVAAGAAAGALNASIYGGDVGKAALIGGIAAGVGYGLASVYAQIPAASTGSNVGNYVLNAAIETAIKSGGGAVVGGAAAEIQGGDFAEGAAEGAAIAGALTIAKIAWLGPKTQLPYTRKQLQYAFDEQTKQYDRSGLNLELPKEGSYTPRAGGLAPLVMRTHAFGRNLSFRPSELTLDKEGLSRAAHELRHIAQVQHLGLARFLGEYSRIVPAQVRFSFTGNPSDLYGSSSLPGFRLEIGPSPSVDGRYYGDELSVYPSP